MKVIVAGFPKTGTKSMNWALSMLGYKVYDYPENVYLLQQYYKKILHNGWSTEDFQKMYENVDAVVDTPACYFWEEIHKAFPDAKIILTMRDSDEEWLQSMKNLVAVSEHNVMMRLLEILSPTQLKAKRDVINAMGMITLGWEPQSVFTWKYRMNDEMLKLKYRAHNAYVLQAAPKDKLLVYKCSDGWGPLCEFLGVPEPEAPFPHKNKAGNIVPEVLETYPIFLRMQREVTLACVLMLAGTGVFTYYTIKLGPSSICKSIANSVGEVLGSAASYLRNV